MVADNHHIARHASPSKIDRGKPSDELFRLKGHEYLSANWPEYYSSVPGLRAQLLAIVEELRRERAASAADGAPKGRQVRDGDFFAVLPVHVAKAIRAEIAAGTLIVEHLPNGHTPSHIGVFGYPPGKEALMAERLATKASPAGPVRDLAANASDPA